MAASGLVALAADRVWMSTAPGDDAAGTTLAPALEPTPQMPLTFSLALVTLAVWGVLLVTRGRLRRVVAVLGLLAAAGSVAATAAGWWLVPDQLRAAAAVTGGSAAVDVSAWYPVALAAGVVAVAASGLAVLRVPRWPEMARRYDAPDSAPAGQTAGDAPRDGIEAWKALDEGRDPTV